MDNINELLLKPLWQMNGEEYCQLHQYACQISASSQQPRPNVLCASVHALAEYLGCCDATIYQLKKDGVLDDAVVSRIGKKIIFDGEKARELANAYKSAK